MGYGVIASEDDKIALIDYGALVGPERSAIGERLIYLYNELVKIIQNHHQPQKSSISKMESSIVYLADTICMMMGIGGGLDGLAYRFHKEIIDQLEFSEKDLQDIMIIFGEKIQDIESLVSGS